MAAIITRALVAALFSSVSTYILYRRRLQSCHQTSNSSRNGSTDEDLTKCRVCHQNIIGHSFTLSCRHRFHYDCISNSLAATKVDENCRCPTCNKDLSHYEIIQFPEVIISKKSALPTSSTSAKVARSSLCAGPTSQEMCTLCQKAVQCPDADDSPSDVFTHSCGGSFHFICVQAYIIYTCVENDTIPCPGRCGFVITAEQIKQIAHGVDLPNVTVEEDPPLQASSGVVEETPVVYTNHNKGRCTLCKMDLIVMDDNPSNVFTHSCGNSFHSKCVLFYFKCTVENVAVVSCPGSCGLEITSEQIKQVARGVDLPNVPVEEDPPPVSSGVAEETPIYRLKKYRLYTNHSFRTSEEEIYKTEEKNLCIFGITESTNENDVHEVIETFKNMGIYMEVNELVCKRIGHRRNEVCPRPLLVMFRDPWSRRLVLKRRYKLRGSNVFIREIYRSSEGDQVQVCPRDETQSAASVRPSGDEGSGFV